MNVNLDTALKIGYLILSVIYLSCIHLTPYPGQFLVKVMPILLLLVMSLNYLSAEPRLYMAAAIIASGTGDVFLALSIENSFIFGLAAFLVSHIIYTAFYFKNRNAGFSKQIRIIAGTIFVFALLMSLHILPKTGELLIPVTVYLTVISIMTITAWHSRFPNKVGFGAVVFMCSDAMIAQNMFAGAFPLASYAIMSTYYGAQFMMVTGVIETEQSA